MANNFLIATGTILKDYMDARNITQKELAEKISSSERHISNLINGKAKLSEDFALKLEKVFPDIKAEFWMDIENKYRLKLLRIESNNQAEMREISKDYQFGHVFKGLKYNLVKQADEMLKILGVKDFQEEENINNLNYSFMEDGGNKKAIYVWLKLCEYELDIQNNLEDIKKFDIDGLRKGMPILKKLINTENFELAEKNIRRFLNNYGIALVVMEAVPTSKIRGATSIVDGVPVIFLSTRFNRFDTFYFTLIHEIEHIFSKDIYKRYQITLEDEELLSNEAARNFFVDENEYREFCNRYMFNKITAGDIIAFANKQKVVPSIIVGFLQRDGIIDHSEFNEYRIGIN